MYAKPSAITDPSAYIREHIRSVPDWPEPGVTFKDITPDLAPTFAVHFLSDDGLIVTHWRSLDMSPPAAGG